MHGEAAVFIEKKDTKIAKKKKEEEEFVGAIETTN